MNDVVGHVVLAGRDEYLLAGNLVGAVAVRLRLRPQRADFGARQTLYAASQDLPGNSYVGPKFGMRGPTAVGPRSRLASNADTAKALWELSEQLTGTGFPL